MEIKRLYTERKAFLVLMFLWLTVQLLMYYRFGFVRDFEGLKYRIDAQEILRGAGVDVERLFYGTYLLVIAVFLKLKIGLYAVLFLQLLMNAVATILFYRLSKIIYPEGLVAVLTTGLFIVCPQIQMWNFYLFTESLFISLLIAFVYVLFRADFSRPGALVGLILLSVLLSFMRPVGVLVIIPATVFFFRRLRLGVLRFRRLVPLFVVWIVLIGLHLIYSSSRLNVYTERSWQSSWVIAGYDGFVTLFNDESLELWGALKLLAYRTFYYFSMLRPYYSKAHNLLIMLFYPVYILVLAGLGLLWRRQREYVLFVLLLILVFSGLSIFTFLNWHGRFIAPLLPFFVLLAGSGIEYFIRRWHRRKGL